MKYVTTAAFDGDYRRLSPGERKRFRTVVQEAFIPAAEAHVAAPGSSWPKALRVKAIQGTTGVWEMTWNFAGPDGRATFEWVTIDGERGIRWRRVGGHAIFADP